MAEIPSFREEVAIRRKLSAIEDKLKAVDKIIRQNNKNNQINIYFRSEDLMRKIKHQSDDITLALTSKNEVIKMYREMLSETEHSDAEIDEKIEDLSKDSRPLADVAVAHLMKRIERIQEQNPELESLIAAKKEEVASLDEEGNKALRAKENRKQTHIEDLAVITGIKETEEQISHLKQSSQNLSEQENRLNAVTHSLAELTELKGEIEDENNEHQKYLASLNDFTVASKAAARLRAETKTSAGADVQSTRKELADNLHDLHRQNIENMAKRKHTQQNTDLPIKVRYAIALEEDERVHDKIDLVKTKKEQITKYIAALTESKKSMQRSYSSSIHSLPGEEHKRLKEQEYTDYCALIDNEIEKSSASISLYDDSLGLLSIQSANTSTYKKELENEMLLNMELNSDALVLKSKHEAYLIIKNEYESLLSEKRSNEKSLEKTDKQKVLATQKLRSLTIKKESNKEVLEETYHKKVLATQKLSSLTIKKESGESVLDSDIETAEIKLAQASKEHANEQVKFRTYLKSIKGMQKQTNSAQTIYLAMQATFKAPLIELVNSTPNKKNKKQRKAAIALYEVYQNQEQLDDAYTDNIVNISSHKPEDTVKLEQEAKAMQENVDDIDAFSSDALERKTRNIESLSQNYRAKLTELGLTCSKAGIAEDVPPTNALIV
ncbi:MAG: hypothetical protein HOI53_05390 [Francisellaceae bacterium]|nr:hypothetical protein [Francisellaceae bacterium]